MIDKLETRFKAIEENLGKDKSRLDNHEMALAGMADEHKEIHSGLTAICKFMLVLGTYGNIGDNDKIKDASAELQQFLAGKL